VPGPIFVNTACICCVTFSTSLYVGLVAVMLISGNKNSSQEAPRPLAIIA